VSIVLITNFTPRKSRGRVKGGTQSRVTAERKFFWGEGQNRKKWLAQNLRAKSCIWGGTRPKITLS